MRFDNDKEISLKNSKDRDRFYSKMSEEQKLFFHSIKENIFTFCEASAGTGKTHVSVAAMMDLLANGEVNKVIYIQKVSSRALEYGFLPGTLEEKTESLWTPFYDAMLTLGYLPEIVGRMRQQELICLTTDATLRGVNFENAGIILDECLDGKSRIATEIYNYKLKTLHTMYKNNEQLPKVLTINENTNEKEYKNIISVVYKGNRETMSITASNRKIRCTYSHPILTIDGWKRADSLAVGDILVASNRNSNQMLCMYNNDQEQLLIGSYLGDGSFRCGGVNKYTGSLVHGEKQVEYLKWKASILGCEDNITYMDSGYSENSLVFRARIDTFASKLPFKTQSGRKNLHIPQEIIDKIEPKAIAIWFMDDGSLAQKQNSSSISCNAFDLDSIERLCAKLNKFDIYPSISTSKEFYYLRFNKSETYKISKLICDYVPTCMEYKIIDEFRGQDKYMWNTKMSEFGYTVVTKLDYDKITIPVYDMEVEDNHNFCIVSCRQTVGIDSPGIFVHNCQNCDEETLRLIFTRCHDSCHVVMIGDVKQKDNRGRNDDFVRYGDYLANSKLGNKCYLTKNYRGKFSQLAENYYGG